MRDGVAQGNMLRSVARLWPSGKLRLHSERSKDVVLLQPAIEGTSRHAQRAGRAGAIPAILVQCLEDPSSLLGLEVRLAERSCGRPRLGPRVFDLSGDVGLRQ